MIFLDLLWYPIQFFLKFILVRPFHFYGYPFPKGPSFLLKFINFFYNWTWKVLLLFVNHYQNLSINAVQNTLLDIILSCKLHQFLSKYFLKSLSISFEITNENLFHLPPILWGSLKFLPQRRYLLSWNSSSNLFLLF